MAEIADLEPLKAYRVVLQVEVLAETWLLERHHGPELSAGLTRPLLRAVNLLERVPHAYEFHSLQELQSMCSDTRLFERGNAPPVRLAASLGIPAVLTEGERIVVKVLDSRVSLLEARSVGTQQLRPPVAER